METDVLIIGSGIAGCAAALAGADAGAEVLILSKEPDAEESNTRYAQGGIIYRGLTDSPDLLTADIMAAGAGMSWEPAVRLLAELGPELVQSLFVDRLGVPFDRENGIFHLTQEAAHSQPRILHQKDHTGRAIEHSVMDAVRAHPRIQVLTDHTAVDLLTLSHHSLRNVDVYAQPTVFGAYVYATSSGHVYPVLARQTILASGGLGRIFLHTTNPAGARGDGIAMAGRAGARLINMQFVQFHPTALYHPSGRFLLSEALRGEGATLVNAQGEAFMTRYHPDGPLAPRDVVARGILQMMLESGEPCAYLDISHKPADWIRSHFPDIHAKCASLGFDLTAEPIPVVPAAHYACGGVAVDLWGRTSLNRFLAVGEVACTGVHGANRLASTSLLEGLVWGTRAGEEAARAVVAGIDSYMPQVAPWRHEHEPVDPALIAQDWMTIRHTMWNYVGLMRTERRLTRAKRILTELEDEIEEFYATSGMSDGLIGLRNGIRTAMIILQAALQDRQSRGCHYRADETDVLHAPSPADRIGLVDLAARPGTG
ncbi:MAG: L-aspartate oxidase [Candidatus Sericytochromatia bacterium]|nr:L-aspartate oxidase [Candidatus Sericytochromatia bacterium]